MNSVKTKYIDLIAGREELENLLNSNYDFSENVLISIINPYNKYENVKKQIFCLEDFLISDKEELLFPVYAGNGKFKKRLFTKKNINQVKKYLQGMRRYLQKAIDTNVLFDMNAVPLKQKYKKRFFDVLSVSFWDVTEDLEFYKPISKKEAKEIAKFIHKHKNSKKKYIIHCSAGISRSAGVGMAIHCCLDFDGDISKFKKETCDIYNHERYRPNEYVFEKICRAFKGLK